MKAYPQGKVIEALLADETKQSDKNQWQLQKGHIKSFEEFLSHYPNINTIYFLGEGKLPSTDTPESKIASVEQNQEQGVLSLYHLLKALEQQGIIHRPLKLKVITAGAHYVLPLDEVAPYGASLLGLAQSAAREYSQLAVSCIDLPCDHLFKENDSLIFAILAETGTPKKVEIIALRNGMRYKRLLEPVTLPEASQSVFKKNGNYLIIGGAGGLGFVLSKYLAESCQAQLIWIGRSSAEHHQDKINQIQKAGGKVYYHQADATDLNSLQDAVQKARAEVGSLHGAIHSALVLKDKTIANMDEATFREALAPKVMGSVLFHHVLQDDPLDFMLFFSSVQSYLGNAGQSNYAAGCTFQDAFVQSLNAIASYPIKTINWGYWGDVGSGRN